ncbi:MAG TPA: tRNA pseudouridine(55) synthase TruB [Dehalococcoidales bacterium]|nr:tRNA pseudouridine(55) synthase TruB [Dehalococcoidales bacterium]
MDGIFNIHKSSGMTSFAVVAKTRRITGEKHIGHAGTLDPLASGVLPVCLGQATRITEYLFNETKTYRAELKLGVTTDTFDCEGKILTECDASHITRQKVEMVLADFRGAISQVPPMFSALKHQGRPLYQFARAGLEIERTARPAQIYRLEIFQWENPVFSLDIECSKGTYIRSLAQDIGRSLGCGAIMQNLVRLRVGNFTLEQSLTLEQLEKYFAEGQGEKHLHPVDTALSSFPAVIVNHEQQCSLCHGQPLPAQTTSWPDPGGVVRAYNQGGDFVGMIKFQADLQQWRPAKIFLKNCNQHSQD